MLESLDLSRPIINVFIAVYLFVAWAWRHPVGTVGRLATEPLVRVVRWLGLGQDWSMFTPNPAFTGADLQVIVKRRSGAALVWEPPHTEDLSGWGAFRFFRYRAYANAMMSSWAAGSRASLAEYLLRKYDFGDDPPVEVVYTWIEQPIAPPGAADASGAPVRSVFYTITVPTCGR